jgi:hypothetical protein
MDHRHRRHARRHRLPSVLTATIASRFVQTERAPEQEQLEALISRLQADLTATLGRIETELADVKRRLEAGSEPAK